MLQLPLRHRGLVSSSAMTLIFLGAGHSFAQTSPGPEQSNNVNTPNAHLEEVVVTAQRREQNLQKVASSIISLAGDGLLKEGRTDLSTVLEQVPNVVVQGGPAGSLVSIRGVSEDQPPTATDSPVTISRDEVVDTSSINAKAGFYDINRVEVLRGPQGTLYGRNATGGAVNIITNNPSHADQAGVTAEVGNYGLVHVDGYGNLAINDQLAARIAFTTVSHDGYMSDGANDNDAKSVRTKVLYTPDERLSVLLGAEYTKLGGDGSGDVALSNSGGFRTSNPYTSTYVIFPPPPGTDNLYPNNGTFSGQYQKYFAKIDYDFGPTVLSIIPAYQDDRYKTSYYLTGLNINNTVSSPQESLEIRFASPKSSTIKWVAGAYIYDTRSFSDTISGGFTYTPSTGDLSISPAQTDTQSTHFQSQAVFGEATVPVFKTFRLTVGVRETWDEKHFDLTSINTANQQTVPYQIADISSSSFDYKVNAQYDLTPASMLYAQVSTGYRAGGYNNASLRYNVANTPSSGVSGNPYYKPEKLTSYEAGSKNRLFDNRLQINGDIFYYDYSSYQASSPSATAIPFDITDTAKATVYGAEFDGIFVLTANDRIGLNAAYLHSRFDSFENASDDEYIGKPLSHSPRYTFAPAYDHIFATPGGGSIDAHVDSKWTAKYYVVYTGSSLANNAATQNSFWETNVSVTLRPYDGSRWTLTAYGKNLENNAVRDFYVGAPPSGYVLLDAPRTYGVVVSAKF